MKAFHRIFATLVASALLVSACGGETQKDNSKEGPAPEEITLGIRSDIDTFDPYQTLAEFGASQMLRLSYASLVARDSEDNIVPQLAEKYEIMSTSEAVFTLREGIVCPNGDILTASDVARSYERLADPKTGAPFAPRIFGNEGATFTAEDSKNQITVKLDRPNADMIAALANAGPVICPEGLKDIENLASNPNGPGPYSLVSSQRGDNYVFERREDFVGLPEGTKLADMPKKITLRVIADDSAMANGILTGDITSGIVLGRDGERLEERKNLGKYEAPGYGGDGLVFHQAKGRVGEDVNFRRAIALAIDPDLYNRAATFDRGRTLRTMYTPNMDCYVEENASVLGKVDIKAAQIALDDAGYVVDGEYRVRPDGSPMKLRIIGHNGQNNGPEYLADVLTQLNIDNSIDQASYDRTINAVFSGDFDLFVWPYTGSLGTPAQMVSELAGDLTNSINASGIKNPVYEETAVLGRESETGNCDFWAKGERALLEDADSIPLVWPVSYYFSNGISFGASYYSIDPFTIRSSS